jgi:hypothetical protein
MTPLHLSSYEPRATTRADRKRFDLERPVDLVLVRECVEVALLASVVLTGGLCTRR